LVHYFRFIAFALLALLLLTSLTACSQRENVSELRRGRLSCQEFVERRRVNNYWWEVFFDGQPFIPEGSGSNKVGQCSASRDAQSKALFILLGEDCWILRVEKEKPVLARLEKPEGMDSIEAYRSARWSCRGSCLVWPTQLILVDTNEVRKFPKLPSDFITISPDLSIAVTEGTNDPEHNRLSINLIDMKTSVVSERVVARSDNLWLLDYTSGVEGIGERFRWEGQEGQYSLIYPAPLKIVK
jgi:hypothetical protein